METNTIENCWFYYKRNWRYHCFFQAENRILLSKIDGRIILTDYERRLLAKHGLPIKNRLHEFISIVKLETLLALSICPTNACGGRETKYNFVSWKTGIVR